MRNRIIINVVFVMMLVKLCVSASVDKPQNETKTFKQNLTESNSQNIVENKTSENTTATESVKTDKHEVNIAELAAGSKFFPRWVPFEKDIHELGEFVRTKTKPKKRLALPASYILKTPKETDNYFSKNVTDENETKEVEIKDEDKTTTEKPSTLGTTTPEAFIEDQTTEPPTTEKPTTTTEEPIDPEVLRQRELEKIREEQIKQAKLAEVDELKLKHQEEAKKISESLRSKSSESDESSESESSDESKDYSEEPTYGEPEYSDERHSAEEIEGSEEHVDTKVTPIPVILPKRLHPRGVNISEIPGKMILETVLNNSTGQVELIKDTDLAVEGSEEKVAEVKDAQASASEDGKKHHGPVSSSHSEGAGKESFTGKKEEYGEHGKKAYQGHHKEEKAEKGHHDKEAHHGHYDDHGGHNKGHHHESGHYGDHHHHEGGKKHAEYEEQGKHSKGHSTKGSHDIHKKDEYEKKVEFFEEDGDDGYEDKDGEFGSEHSHEAGGKFGKANLDSAHDEKDHGKKAHHDGGGHSEHHKGHANSLGGNEHHKSHFRHGKKHSKSSGHKWNSYKGTPVKIIKLAHLDGAASEILGLRPPLPPALFAG